MGRKIASIAAGMSAILVGVSSAVQANPYGWTLGFGGTVSGGFSSNSYGDFPSFDGNGWGGGGYAFARYQFQPGYLRSGFFAGPEVWGEGLRVNGTNPDGAFTNIRSFTYEGIQAGYHFYQQGSVPTNVYFGAGASQAWGTVGVNSRFGFGSESMTGMVPGVSVHAGFEFQIPDSQWWLGADYRWLHQSGRIGDDPVKYDTSLFSITGSYQFQLGVPRGIPSTWSPTNGYTPPVVQTLYQIYVDLLVGGGDSRFYETRTRDNFGGGRIGRGFDGFREQRCGSGLFYGGDIGIGTYVDRGFGLALQATVLGSNTENRISMTTSKFVSAVYVLTPEITYRTPVIPIFGLNTPLTLFAGAGAGGTTYGIRREDGTDTANSFTVAAIAGMKVNVTPNWTLGAEGLYYRSNATNVGSRYFGYSGITGMATVGYDFYPSGYSKQF
jgi:opacity protein-like surface antigen